MLVKPAYMCLVAQVVIIFLTAPPPKKKKKKKKIKNFWTSKSEPNLLIYDNIRVPPPTPLRRELTIVFREVCTTKILLSVCLILSQSISHPAIPNNRVDWTTL